MTILLYRPIWFRGGKLPMVSFRPLIHGTVDAQMACSGLFDSEALNANGIVGTNCMVGQSRCECLAWAHQDQFLWYRNGHFLMGHCTCEWFVLALDREHGHMLVLLYGPIWFRGVNCQWNHEDGLLVVQWRCEWPCMGSWESVLMVSFQPLLDGIVNIQMACSGSW